MARATAHGLQFPLSVASADTVFRFAPGCIRDTLAGRERTHQTMGARQKRYREARLGNGWQRVEMLIPAEAVPLLKAYARALRDAATLGSPPPRFDGMGAVTASPGSEAPRAAPPSPARQARPGGIQEAAPTRTAARPRAPRLPVTQPTNIPASGPEAFFDQVAKKRRREAEDASKRPDFSKGLLGDE